MSNLSKNTLSTEEVGRLLNAYYDGNTTAEQENALMQYFCGTEQVPEQYMADAALFRALKAERESIGKVAVPAHLEQTIAKATYAGKHNASRYMYYMRWLSAVAAVAVLAVVAVNLQHDTQPVDTVPTYAASELRSNTVVSPVGPTLADVEQDTITSAVPEAEDNIVPERQVAKVQSKTPDDPYVEVTDSTSVTRIMDDVLGQLSHSLSIANNGVRKVDIALNMSEIINKALKK